MTLVQADEPFDIDDARRLTERIRLIAGNIADNVEKLRDLVALAKDSNTHVLLGYESWTAYLVDVFGDEPLRLARDVRQELVAELAAQGMSTRAIAPIVGVDKDTVRRDLAGGGNTPPASEPIHVDPDTGVVFEPEPVIVTEESVTTTRTITGLDGKTYTRTREDVTAKWMKVADLATQGLTSHQIAREVGLTEEGLRNEARRRGVDFPADRIVGRTHRIDPIEVMEKTVVGLEATLTSLDFVDLTAITYEQAQQWLARIDQPMRALRQLQTNLKGIQQ